MTARFGMYCGSCSYAIWPHFKAASEAFRRWRDHDPASRAMARPYDLELPVPFEPAVVDYEARAHELGLHIFPNSRWPFTITVGLFFGFLGLAPFPAPMRIALGVIGGLIFLVGVIGWVVIEDTRMYPTEEAPGGRPHSGAH
jgi:hypothetical protein